MRRRFGRGRSGGSSGDARGAPIDARAVFARIVEIGAVAADSLTPVEDGEIASRLAVVASGESRDGRALVVGFAPRNGGDAALAAIAHAQARIAADGFDGEVVAVAPQWTIAARRRLALIGELAFPFRAVVASPLAEGVAAVQVESGDALDLRPPAQVAASPPRASDRPLFQRALAAFEGLAAKHGGAVRAVGGSVELVVLARRVASLRAEEDGITLTTLLPERSTATLSAAELAAEMDRVEGSLRKRLNDRRARSGEEGLRARLIAELAGAAGLRGTLAWPLGGSEPEILDLAGVAEDGGAAIGAIRSELSLVDLGAILDAALALRPALPALLAQADEPLRRGTLTLLLAAERLDAAVANVLPALALGHAVYDVAQRRGRDPELMLRGSEAGAARRSEPAPAEPRATERPRPGRRPPRPAAAESSPRAFEEVSIFDLDSEEPSAADSEPGGARRRSRRGRGRRRGRRGRPGGEAAPEGSDTAGTADAPFAEPEATPEPEAREPERRGRRRDRERRRRPPAPAPSASEPLTTDDELDLPETLAPLAEDAPEIEEVEVELGYEDEEEIEEVNADEERMRREREARRQARVAKASPEPSAPPAPPPRRRRAAIVAHGDRGSLLAAILLARDVRTIEGFWVYPQDELMTFFRSVATDLGDGTPIYLVGFTAYPARDVLQAASLYRGRLEWFDHHDWPPEDLERLREAIEPQNVHVQPGAGSSLPGVLKGRTRRSRFSDKLVELASGRFSLHDHERWGRLWWHRLGEIAAHSGPRRPDIEPLLVGRPSDLAREASRAGTPPPPPEVAFVSERDFKLVHFGGYVLVVVPTPPELDALLASRIARERFSAQVSVAHVEGSEAVLLGCEEGQGRRNLDLGSMVDHLASKHEWIEALPDEDHVSRLRVQGLAEHPERLAEVIGEIAMGRSILEG